MGGDAPRSNGDMNEYISTTTRHDLRDDLISAVLTDGVRIASRREAWRALTWWGPMNLVVQPAVWVLIVGAGLLTWAADDLIVSRLLPEMSIWPGLGRVGLGAVGVYLLATAVASIVVTSAPGWVLFSDDERTAVIGARVRCEDTGLSVVVNNHVARHIGTGEGRRLRTKLGPGVAAFMTKNPHVALRYTAQNQDLARAYLRDIATALPSQDDWEHHLEGRRATARRARWVCCTDR